MRRYTRKQPPKQDYKCQHLKPGALLEILGFKQDKTGWIKKSEGFIRYHCQTTNQSIVNVHQDLTILSKGRRMTRHKAEPAPELMTTIEFIDSRYSARNSDDLLSPFMGLPSCVIEVSKTIRDFLRL